MSIDDRNYQRTHVPVLLDEITSLLSSPDHVIHVDCTLGFGGHAHHLLRACPTVTTLMGVDMDSRHLEYATQFLTAEHPQTHLIFEHSPFRHIGTLCQKHALCGKVTGFLFDLGLCSSHVDNGFRGFSFRADGPLDMRFDETSQLTAQTIIQTYSEEQLADIIYTYGEERASRKIAKAIVAKRAVTPITTTQQLADIIAETMRVPKHIKHHPATKTFQALRIAVNDELTQIHEALTGAWSCLAPGGKLAVISYHSLEDRIVKNYMKLLATEYAYENDLPTTMPTYIKQGELLTKKPIVPKEEEILYNKRARSAKLRIIQKLPSTTL